ncbi:hypothetical protein A2154_03555 [Candidatus Gottesmanbacteria bacterium RBG_16_43_7]|uniref:dTDP-4-dehydrorhamnose reductase n=1 Tax=Candidatus Gottesmanbacteria bacterium RBG_16_43_7 TaxID=1798373 RepID=A0A1F5Z815_9BACT|nr:MAG: hypothetical protein A2154_03555 [Candidatus Gottesmanbacteria bacterium RBG_16_43_7]
MKVLGTGLNGLVGSRIVELLNDYEFENLSLETGIDITDYDTVKRHIANSDAPWILHMAAFTDVDKAELDRVNGQGGLVWRVNAQASGDIAKIAGEYSKRVLYLSTDYVFAGDNDTYTETDTPNPLGWYGITKYEGELRVMVASDKNVVVRTANPYRAVYGGKKDFVHAIAERLIRNQTVFAPTDQIFVPTFIDDIATAITFIFNSEMAGIYHAVGPDVLSPYQAARAICHALEKDQALVRETTFSVYFRNRAPRPLRANLKNDKMAKSGIKFTPFTEGLGQVIFR